MLTPTVRNALVDPLNDRFISIVSVWEIQIKNAKGKLALNGLAHEIVPLWAEDLAASLLPIELKHLGGLYRLPFYHNDPFDRLIIAQALGENLTLVSSDSAFHSYPIRLLC